MAMGQRRLEAYFTLLRMYWSQVINVNLKMTALESIELLTLCDFCPKFTAKIIIPTVCEASQRYSTRSGLTQGRPRASKILNDTF